MRCTGEGVHVVTVNEYLAQRDADWMGPIFRFLGLTRRRHQERRRAPPEKRAAYACDITYGTNNEFGFDYLRDNLAFRLEDRVQRGLVVRDRRRGGLDPHRRGAHAAHHLRPRRGEHRAVPAHQPARAAPQAPAGRERARRFLGRREEQAGAHHRGGPRARRGADGAKPACCARARACTTPRTSA